MEIHDKKWGSLESDVGIPGLNRLWGKSGIQ